LELIFRKTFHEKWEEKKYYKNHDMKYKKKTVKIYDELNKVRMSFLKFNFVSCYDCYEELFQEHVFVEAADDSYDDVHQVIKKIVYFFYS
jgi:hypothetical protein